VRLNGVCYDAGRVMLGQDWRPDFSPGLVRRELEVIRDGLHASAVRICGASLERLEIAAAAALELGLEVFLAPELWDRSPAETLAYIDEAALLAERLRRGASPRLTLSVGSELTLFMQGIVPGGNVLERLAAPEFWRRVQEGRHNAPLNAFLAEAAGRARRAFSGPLTYAAVPLETVDWRPFDVVSVDIYRDARVRPMFGDLLRRFAAEGPLYVTEFGCCTYRGAADAGGRGWEVVVPDGQTLRLKPGLVRDEGEQAAELSDSLAELEASPALGAFVMTFVSPTMPYSEDPARDLDMASYSLVRSGPGAPSPRYPDMPWRPKEAFAAVARHYLEHPPA